MPKSSPKISKTCPPPSPRDKVIKVLVTDHERDVIRKRLRTSGGAFSLSSFMRWMALSAPLPSFYRSIFETVLKTPMPKPRKGKKGK